MLPRAFTSPVVTAASRCCSASVRRTRFAASLRPGGRPSGFLSDSLPPTFCFFFRASSFSCSHAANQADSGKKAAKGAPGRPRRTVAGGRTEGVGHEPDALRTLSEPPGDSGAVPEGAVAAHLPREWRATCTAPAAPGHGTADWIAVPLQFFYAPRSQRCF